MNANFKKSHLAKLSSEDPSVKFGFARRLLKIAEQNPSALYQHLNDFLELLESDNKIIQWTGIRIIGSLAAVDKKGQVVRNRQRLVRFLKAGNLIAANHAITALA